MHVMSSHRAPGLSMRILVAVAGVALALSAGADEQTWLDANVDNLWSSGAANWDTGVWVDANDAVFGGIGELVEIDGAVSVANLTFNVNGYTIADANANGTLTLVGAPSLITVTSAGHTAIVSEAIGGSAGFTKQGAGVLQITGANTFAGQLLVSAGTLRLSAANAAALGATDAGNETIVTNGATLDFAGAYSGGNRAEDFIISGSGVGGNGALVNSGSAIMNAGLRNLTLAGDATIGGAIRLDLGGVGWFAGNGYTLTKAGAMEMAVTRYMSNCTIVINGGLYTIQHANALGAADHDTYVNGGRLNCWGNHNIPERIVFGGGGMSQGSSNTTLNLSGYLTFTSNTYVNSAIDRRVLLSGTVDGAGGVTNLGAGALILASDGIAYGGETVVGSGSYVHVGTNGLAAGRPGLGRIVNNGVLLFDRAGAYTLSNTLAGAGVALVRYGGSLTLDGSVSTTAMFRISNGALSLANGASLTMTGAVTMAERGSAYYGAADPTSVVAVLNVGAGTAFTAAYIEIGNGTNIVGGSMLATINQSGGTVRTTGTAAENNGLRMGHYPQAYSVYNMSGGTLVIDNGYDLGIATDGTGWVHQTGGEIFATTVMLNERANTGGHGRLTVEGGTLHVGSGGITRDATAPYLVEYGGAGGVVRATASFASPLDATLSGSGGSAITFDTTEETITLSGALGGAGGLNKTGVGVLKLTGANSYAGATAVSNGTLEADGVYTGGGLITVHDGATLSGTGSVAAVTVADNGTVVPGTSAGTLTVGGALTLAGASVLDYELDAPDPVGGVGGDFITGIQGLTLDGVLNVTSLGFDFLTANVGDQWKLMSFSGTLTDNTLSLGSMPGLGGGKSYAVTVTGDSVILGVVPEPGALGLLGLGAVVWILRRRA